MKRFPRPDEIKRFDPDEETAQVPAGTDAAPIEDAEVKGTPVAPEEESVSADA